MTRQSLSKTGILLINLGTPTAPTAPAVRGYLKAFLSDPYVINLPWLLRWLLVNGIILPFHTKKSVSAYQKIWSAQHGSPLRYQTQALCQALQAHLAGSSYKVSVAMRYGEPSLEDAVAELLSDPTVQQFRLVPLYPQYAESTTRSSLERATQLIQQHAPQSHIDSIDFFFDHPKYLHSKAKCIQNTLQGQTIDRLLFSYHGLPTHSLNSVCQTRRFCTNSTPCPAIRTANQRCYRAQCYATSHQIAKILGLQPNEYLTSFQSRLGRTPWIKPYTDTTLFALAHQKLKRVAVVCPSFVVDCLETLEEIDLRERQRWQTLGGTHFIRIPCLNTAPYWISALADLMTQPPIPSKTRQAHEELEEVHQMDAHVSR